MTFWLIWLALTLGLALSLWYVLRKPKNGVRSKRH